MPKCEKCNFETAKNKNFLRHICKEITDFQCEFCDKYYSEQKTLTRHMLICKKKSGESQQESQQEFKQELESIELLQEKYNQLLGELDTIKKNINNINITNNNNNNNNIINNNNNIFINVTLPHKKTNIDHLTDEDYFNILGRSLMSIPLMIEKIHFNENNPENHNIYIPNIKNKFAMLYNGSEWSLHSRDEIIDNMIIDNEMRLEDWLSREDIQEKYPTAFKRFELYLKLKEKNANVNRMKEDVLLLLYNKRNMIEKSRQRKLIEVN